MRLFVLRHGKAGEGYPDAIRELTEHGRNEVADVMALRADELGELGLVLHSPLVRARQTADLVLASLDTQPEVRECDLIKPESSAEVFCDFLAAEFQDVLICSHNPFVADLVSYLTGHLTAMPTAALAALEYETPMQGAARLLWLETP